MSPCDAQGKLADSLQQFDAAIAADPDIRPYMWQRQGRGAMSLWLPAPVSDKLSCLPAQGADPLLHGAV